jgi:hypothetical protein
LVYVYEHNNTTSLKVTMKPYSLNHKNSNISGEGAGTDIREGASERERESEDKPVNDLL